MVNILSGYMNLLKRCEFFKKQAQIRKYIHFATDDLLNSETSETRAIFMKFSAASLEPGIF